MRTNTPVLVFENFSFCYHAQAEPTLKNIDLTIQEGEKVLIVGPSGSGKSTLGHCMNGLAPAFYPGTMTGTLLVRNKPIQELNIFDLSEEIGTVLQDPDGQFVGLTVKEDIAFTLENEAIPQQEMIATVAKATLAVDMEAHLDASPQELSGGQKQRTSLGGVLVSNADILLFDEPLANLDPHTGKLAIELIDRIHKELNKTIVIIEHRLEDVLHRNVDRIVVMQDGNIIADLSPQELLCSDLLQKTGIREPLYVTTLAYAGCELTPDMLPQRIDQIDLTGQQQRLLEWSESLPVPAKSPSSAQPLLELEGISFGYDSAKPILHDISLEIKQGEMVSIVGKNGAGKSTLSKLICGFYRPSAGTMRYKGVDMAGDTIKERANRVGFVMQNPNHMLSKTMLFEEVALGLRMRGIEGDELNSRVYDALKVCGLYSFRNWPISALSFGQKKRATIASILALQPEALILDEPTAGQDFRHYNEMMEFLLELNKQGVTIIMITHDMHLMLEYADRTIVMADGRLLADTEPSVVLTDQRLIEAANLKATSVYELAQRARIPEPRDFVARFIAEDRRRRRG